MLRRFTLLTTAAVVAAVLAGVATSASNGIVASATGSGQSTFSGEQRTSHSPPGGTPTTRSRASFSSTTGLRTAGST